MPTTTTSQHDPVDPNDKETYETMLAARAESVRNGAHFPDSLKRAIESLGFRLYPCTVAGFVQSITNDGLAMKIKPCVKRKALKAITDLERSSSMSKHIVNPNAVGPSGQGDTQPSGQGDTQPTA